MSDISFKQAKELTQRLELVEVTLQDTLKKIDTATTNFDNSLKRQVKILEYMPRYDKTLMAMKLIIALNIGFLIGLLTAKYI